MQINITAKERIYKIYRFFTPILSNLRLSSSHDSKIIKLFYFGSIFLNEYSLINVKKSMLNYS